MSINSKRICLVCVLLTFFLSGLNATPQRDYYRIKNMSGEDLLITVRYITGQGWTDVSGNWHEVTKRPFLMQGPNPHIGSFDLFNSDPERNGGMWSDENGKPLYNLTRSAKKMLDMVVSELILHDLEENVVLTLDDIEEEDFEYTDQQQRLSPCVMVTREMVQAGRRKYAGIVME